MDKLVHIFLLFVPVCIVTTNDCQYYLDQVISNNQFYPPLDESDGRKPLVFGLIMSFGGSFDSSGAVPGVRVALDRINNDSSLLPGYSLHYALSNSQVSLIQTNDVLLMNANVRVHIFHCSVVDNMLLRRFMNKFHTQNQRG